MYLDRLVAALAEIDGIEVLEACNRRRRPAGGRRLASVANAVCDQWWAEVTLPRLARAARADVIHHPLPALSRTSGIPQVVTVHDLAFESLPKLFDPRFRIYALFAHRVAARHAGAVVCVSETTAAEVRRAGASPPGAW